MKFWSSIKSKNWGKIYSKKLLIFKNVFSKFKFLFLKIKSKNSSKKRFQFRFKGSKYLSSLKFDFIFRHASLFLLVIIVMISNFLMIKKSQAISEEFISEISLSESSAVSEEDLVSLVGKINQYSPKGAVKIDPEKVIARLYPKDQILMSDGQYITKPSVLITYSDSKEGLNATNTQNTQERRKIFDYEVKPGETISIIAKKFGISVSTIKSTNSLNSDNIRPGQKLVILPADGVLHVVQKGEVLSRIVAKYGGELHRTIEENGLGTGASIFAGQKIVIIGGKKPVSTIASSRTNTASSRVAGIVVNRAKGPNHFPFGWCTWYVASRRFVPWSGNAGTWPRQAVRYGFKVGRTPAAGAILVTHESWWGHVAYVEAVHGSRVTISEMNFTSWGRVNYRTVSASYGVYIY